MIKNNNPRAKANLAMLEFAAKKLGKLKDEMIFLGGCTTSIFITDPAPQDIRSTIDVDCIVDVISINHYYDLGKRLNNLGFNQSSDDDVICRWRYGYDELILDVMPIDEKILGFSNRWYKAAAEHAVIYPINENIFIKSVTAPYFLATKLEAFKQRGKNDYFASHDFEDIISVIDGRAEIVDEIANSDSMLKNHLIKIFSNMLNSEKFHAALPGHLRYGSLTSDRVHIVLHRIQKIVE